MSNSSNYVFFWGHSKNNRYGCLSNWYPASFVKDAVSFSNTDQYMMYRKALLMGDDGIVNKILVECDPKRVKSLGRKVKNWNEELWIQHREQIMYDGCLAKFQANSDMKAVLLSTGEKQLVEASPFDSIWGIGMRAKSNGVEDPENWKGLNLLGKTLDKVKVYFT